MRCQFCGWDNAQGKETCEKCGKPLRESEARPINNDRLTDRKDYGRIRFREPESFNPKKTIRESSFSNDNSVCPQCGYAMEDGSCANCGYNINESEPTISRKPIEAEVRKTTRPLRKEGNEVKKAFSLIPISESTGEPEGEKLSFEGDYVSLNRGNTDPENNTITSQEQAIVAIADGEWTIEDRSEYKTTFVQAARKVVLKDGDIILMGNQLFRFES